MQSNDEIYKPLRKSEIAKEEKKISDVMYVLQDEYLNPFSPRLEQDMLLNLSSGVPAQGNVDDLLGIWKNGKDLADRFTKERLVSKEKSFNDPIPRVKVPTFHQTDVKLSKNKQLKVVEANRNIIGRLLSISIKSGQPINLEASLMYPLFPFPLSLANPDGTKRSTQKSKLLEIITPKGSNEVPLMQEMSTYVVDMIAQLRMCITGVSGTFESLAKRFLHSLPTGYRRVDVVADTYRDNSIKSGERLKRGNSDKIIIGSIKSKLPYDMTKFMLNNENKTNLIQLIFDYTVTNKDEILKRLESDVMFLSGDNITFRLTANSAGEYQDLKSNQEEADTKVILHVHHALVEMEGKVVLRNPSGDTDILVIALGLLSEEFQNRVYYDVGSGKNRKGEWLSDYHLDEAHKQALVGFHAFTGNDYVSCFFRKGKKLCWNLMVGDEKFLEAFTSLGDGWLLSDDTMAILECYVCKLYGVRKSSVNLTRFEIFSKKHSVENKIIDLSLLPPCQTSLRLHTLRASFISAMWKRSMEPVVELPSVKDNGWDDLGKIEWISGKPFPEDVSELLMVDSESEDEDYGTDCESDLEV